MSTPTPGVAGWLADPAGRNEYRWWDGSSWTDQVATGGVGSVDALTGPAAPVAPAPPGPPAPPAYGSAPPAYGFGAPPPPASDATVTFGSPPGAPSFGAPPLTGTYPAAPAGPPSGPYGARPPGPPAGGGADKVPFIVAGVLVVVALVAGILLFAGGDEDVAGRQDTDRSNRDDEASSDTETEETTTDAPGDDDGLGGPNALGEDTFSAQIVAGTAEVDITDLSIAAGTALVIRVAPDSQFDASVAILGDEAQAALFTDFAPALAQAFLAIPAGASPGVTAAVTGFGFTGIGAPTSALFSSDAPNTDPGPFPPVVLFEEDPGASGGDELFVLFAPEDVDVQLAVTGYNGSQGSFDAGLTFVEVGGAPDPATFAAAIANDPNLAELLG